MFTVTGWCCLKGKSHSTEATPLLYFGTYKPDETKVLQQPTSELENEINIWSIPDDYTHIEADDDRELYELIQQHSGLPPGSPQYSDVEAKINSIRAIRKETQKRWKAVLQLLGFSKSVEDLVSVTGLATSAMREGISHETYILFHELEDETAIFTEGNSQPDRYLIVMNRLVDLDIGKDFVKMAKRSFPRRHLPKK
ncbi:melanoregulin-like [Antedon mediterranea]|uniref:melanoregulin-like n=1 Tax=Antedon mediterranea TaxID=105859 RepID=UPI003AF6B1B7